jgi:hypothetical protein
MLEVRDPADVRSVVAAGLRFYTRIKTAAVRFAW